MGYFYWHCWPVRSHRPTVLQATTVVLHHANPCCQLDYICNQLTPKQLAVSMIGFVDSETGNGKVYPKYEPYLPVPVHRNGRGGRKHKVIMSILPSNDFINTIFHRCAARCLALV